ncbi:MAG TPA: IclR family transcriptional regulator C-terminal domain-containing protein [Xanthobacteraceae bacterium]|nr:IclR family transcriptional regulator C-terminal domain-containing protein [Xanthobacteraceae bacterium]
MLPDMPRTGRTSRERPDDDREYMAGLAKGLAILEAFGSRKSRLSLSEACEIAGLSRAAGRRCLRTLQQLGYAVYDGKYFLPAPRVLRLGHAYLIANPLTRVVQPTIEAVSERTKHSVAASVLDGVHVVVVARALVQRSLSAGLAVGGWLPAYCSANGRILLSGFPDPEVEAMLNRMERTKLTPHTRTEVREVMQEIKAIRSRGYAINEQEVELGLTTIAVPIRTRNGDIVASLSMSSIDNARERRNLVRLVPELQATSMRLAALL